LNKLKIDILIEKTNNFSTRNAKKPTNFFYHVTSNDNEKHSNEKEF